MSHLHDKNAVVPADKAPYNIVFVCKSYITSTDKDLGIDNSLGDPTYTPTTLTKEEILDNHKSVLLVEEIGVPDENNRPDSSY